MNTQDFKHKIADIIGPTRKRKKLTVRGPRDRGYNPPQSQGFGRHSIELKRAKRIIRRKNAASGPQRGKH